MPELSMKALVSVLALSLVARASLARQIAPSSEYYTEEDIIAMQDPPLSEGLGKSLRGRAEKATDVKLSQESEDNTTQSNSTKSVEPRESEPREDEPALSALVEDEAAHAEKLFQAAMQSVPTQRGEQAGDSARTDQSVNRSDPVELSNEEMEAQMIPSQGEEMPPEGEPSQQSDASGNSPSDSVIQTKQTVSWVDQSQVDPSGSQQPDLSPDELADEMMEGQDDPPPVGGYTRAKAELMIAQVSQELHGIDKDAVAKMKDTSQYQTNTEAYQEAGDLIQAAKEDLANARPLSPAKSLEAAYRQAEEAHKDVARLRAISVNKVMFAM